MYRDTMMKGYTSAYAGDVDEHPPVKEMYPIAYALLRLALIITCSKIA